MYKGPSTCVILYVVIVTLVYAINPWQAVQQVIHLWFPTVSSRCSSQINTYSKMSITRHKIKSANSTLNNRFLNRFSNSVSGKPYELLHVNNMLLRSLDCLIASRMVVKTVACSFSLQRTLAYPRRGGGARLGGCHPIVSKTILVKMLNPEKNLWGRGVMLIWRGQVS